MPPKDASTRRARLDAAQRALDETKRDIPFLAVIAIQSALTDSYDVLEAQTKQPHITLLSISNDPNNIDCE